MGQTTTRGTNMNMNSKPIATPSTSVSRRAAPKKSGATAHEPLKCPSRALFMAQILAESSEPGSSAETAALLILRNVAADRSRRAGIDRAVARKFLMRKYGERVLWAKSTGEFIVIRKT
jgi:hypothetical protein